MNFWRRCFQRLPVDDGTSMWPIHHRRTWQWPVTVRRRKGTVDAEFVVTIHPFVFIEHRVETTS